MHHATSSSYLISGHGDSCVDALHVWDPRGAAVVQGRVVAQEVVEELIAGHRLEKEEKKRCYAMREGDS